MAITITLSDSIAERLQAHAAATHLSPDSLVEELLADVLPPVKTNGTETNGVHLPQVPEDEPHLTLEEVVAMIKATPPNPNAIHPATKTAAQLIAELEADPPSDKLLTFEEMWPQWQAFEQELKEMDRAHTFGIPAPAFTEFLFGIQVIPRAALNMREWQRYQDAFRYYDIDRNDAAFAATLQLELRRSGRQLHTVDALIAAVALRYNLTLLTTDKDFQAVPGLAQENWIASAVP